MATPLVIPDPAYIASKEAALIVSREVLSEFHGMEDLEQMHAYGVSSIQAAPLASINSFLDRILLNIILSAQAISLASLRRAVKDVLKPRLAQEAIAGADEELIECVGEDDEIDLFDEGEGLAGDWDLDLIWKRARLRCMVYTRLGDMEEEDEDRYIAQGHISDGTTDNPTRISWEAGLVSPPVAIWLTAILEFIGEHALMLAAHAAYKRTEAKFRNAQHLLPLSPSQIQVLDTDMEKVALNPTLGRLWRAWRKPLRSPRSAGSRNLSFDSTARAGPGYGHSRFNSRSTAFSDMTSPEDGTTREPVYDAASVPLPETEHDIEEIEAPASSSSGRSPKTHEEGRPVNSRPASTPLNILLGANEDNTSDAQPPKSKGTANQHARLKARHMRSRSLPIVPNLWLSSMMTPDEEASRQPTAHADPGRRPSVATDGTWINYTHGEVLSSLNGPQDYQVPANTETRNRAESLARRTKRRSFDPSTDPRSSQFLYHDESDGPAQFDRSDYSVPKQNDPSDYNVDAAGYRKMAWEPLSLSRQQMKRRSLAQQLVAVDGGVMPGTVPAQEPAQRKSSLALPPQSHRYGEISPVADDYVHSGEVSPLEPSDDEASDHVTGLESARRGMAQDDDDRFVSPPESPELERTKPVVQHAQVSPTALGLSSAPSSSSPRTFAMPSAPASGSPGPFVVPSNPSSGSPIALPPTSIPSPGSPRVLAPISVSSSGSPRSMRHARYSPAPESQPSPKHISDLQRSPVKSQHDRVMEAAIPAPQSWKAESEPSSKDHSKEEKREAFVLPQKLDLSELQQQVVSPEAASKAAPSTLTTWKSNESAERSLETRQIVAPSYESPSREGPMYEAMPSTFNPPSSRYHEPRRSLEARPPGPLSLNPISLVTPAAKEERSQQMSNLLERRRQLPAVNTQFESDEATAQHSTPSPSSAHARGSSEKLSRAPSDRHKDSRINGSSSSMRVRRTNEGCGSGDDLRDFSYLRAHSRSTSNGGDEKQHRSSDSSGDKSREFEQLIKSDETIQYTLTPQNIRQIKIGPGIRRPEKDRAKASQGIEQPAPVERTPPRGQTGMAASSSAGSITGIRSAIANSRSNPEAYKNEPTTAGGILRARDARADSSSTKDFADFLRSTGPIDTAKGLPTEPAATPSGSRRGPQPITANSVPRMPATAGLPNDVSSRRPPFIPAGLRRPSTAERKRLVARDAQVETSPTSDLIDFLREGPPPAVGASTVPAVTSNSNLKKSVLASSLSDAPSARHKNVRDTQSTMSTQESFKSNSGLSSANSLTGLLSSSQRADQHSSNTGRSAVGFSKRLDEDMDGPTRKSRKPRDPYEIPDEDDDGSLAGDEEDEEVIYPRDPRARDGKKMEESLMNFLKNPLPISNTQIQFERVATRSGSVSTVTTRKGRVLKKEQSARSPSGRFGSFSSVSSLGRSASANVLGNANGQGQVQGSRTASGPTADGNEPIRNGSRMAPSNPTKPLMPRNPNGAAANGLTSLGRPVTNLQARPPRAAPRSETLDLADFLKNSAPPAEGGGGAGGKVGRMVGLDEPERKERRGLGKIFGARK